jgi:biotin carboxyl carrier protein
MTFDIEVGGHTHKVRVERAGDLYRIDVGGQRYTVDLARVDATTLSLIVNGAATGSHEVGLAVRPTPDEWDVHLRAGVVYTRLDGGRTGAGRVRRSLGADPFAASSGVHQILAPMPGRVVRVLVAPGDEVAARQGLVVIEAMKMENELRAPRAARVKEVRASEGTSVEAGRVLVVLE